MPHCDISISSRPSTIFWGSSVIHPVHRNRRLLPPPHIGAHQAVRPYPHDRPHGRRPHRRRSRPCLASATHAAVHASVTTSPPLRHHCPRQRRPLRHHSCRPDRRHDETVQLCPGGAHMVSGAQQGRLLHMLVRLSRASRVFEVRWQHQRHPQSTSSSPRPASRPSTMSEVGGVRLPMGPAFGPVFGRSASAEQVRFPPSNHATALPSHTPVCTY